MVFKFRDKGDKEVRNIPTKNAEAKTTKAPPTVFSFTRGIGSNASFPAGAIMSAIINADITKIDISGEKYFRTTRVPVKNRV